LAREGLFDADRKRPLPRFPRRVAFVTSPTGAAVRDFLEVLRRRAGTIDVLIVPTRVQGDGAAAEIAQAIAQVNRLRDPPDVLVVGRGGGSLEDLWCFNEEPVVRAIAASRIPTISAVGHEIDITLADLAADVRALTPSEAAERVAPAADELRQLLLDRRGRLVQALHRRALEGKLTLQRLSQSRVFARPFERVQLLGQQIDELTESLHRGMRGRVERGQFATVKAAAQLEALSPLAVLARGYSVTERADDRQLIRSTEQVRLGDQLRSRLAQGAILSRVEAIEPSN
jgi:exodeoxyribonuclease VII large subunit